MSQFDFDLFTIGAGSGGVRASRLAANSGARVAIAEEYRIGGTCVIRGCVPKKLFVYASGFAQDFKDASGFGWTVEWARFDWARLRDNVQAEVTRLSGIYQANLEKANVEIIEQRAMVIGPNAIRLFPSGRVVTAERILIATGGTPQRLDALKGSSFAINSNDVFLLDQLPNRVAIVGGGYIAIEFATIFHGLGVETSLIYRGETILNGFDAEIRAHVQDEMRRVGVNVITGAAPSEIAPVAEGYQLKLSNGQTIEADQIMLAVGRAPATEGLGLETAGVRLTEVGAVAVDAFSRSSCHSIWAIGDVTNRVNLTPVAIREGQAFAETEFYNRPTTIDYADIPTAVFGRPPVAAVGYTEAEARVRFGQVEVFKTRFRPMKHVLAGNEERTLMKLVVRAGDNVVVGVHMAGQDGPEMIQMAAIAVKAGLTKAQWDAVVALHPTAAEEWVLMREPST
jgi:glutathione reductase (NADPH)